MSTNDGRITPYAVHGERWTARHRPVRSRSLRSTFRTLVVSLVRVLTLNCWHVSEPFAERMALIRAGIAALNPDLIGLQEIIVRRDGFDQGALIFHGLPYQHVFGCAFCWDDPSRLTSGEARHEAFGNLIASHIARAAGASDCALSTWDKVDDRLVTYGYHPPDRREKLDSRNGPASPTPAGSSSDSRTSGGGFLVSLSDASTRKGDWDAQIWAL